MNGIEVDDVRKCFGAVVAVDGVSLEIEDGEFFTLLGPSGCGKTTLLRMIAGLETPDGGRLVLRGQDVTDIPANKRSVHMVFQQYALFPHMTVDANVGFGPRLKGLSRPLREARVKELLEVVDLADYGHRMPQQLSGGQQQRVALARALANRPDALLLDEPLGALDVKLRRSLQVELKNIQRTTGTTFVYVTHDQEEALAMSDRIAVMNRGRVEQVGTPREIYCQPASAFVADFVGSLNILDLLIDSVAGGIAWQTYGQKGRIGIHLLVSQLAPGDSAVVGVRPEHVLVKSLVEDVDECASSITGVVTNVTFLGMITQIDIDTSAGHITSQHFNNSGVKPVKESDEVRVSWLTAHGFSLGHDR